MVSITRDDKRRAIFEDIAITLGLPILVLLLHMIVQGHRFDIFEQYGCSPTTYNTIPAYFLFYMWPVLIGLVSLVYSGLTLRSFYVRRIQFTQILSSHNSINPSRYLRLMLLALVDIMCTIPLGIYIIYVDLKGIALQPWISWADTHFDFSRVVLVPAVVWRSDPATVVALELNRWVPIFCALIFFALFGFAEEAMKNYRRVFWFFARPLGFRPSSEGGSRNGKGKDSILAGLNKFKLNSDDADTLPVYVAPAGPVIPSAREKARKSFTEADSRSTICFPDDDDVELGPYRKSFSTRTSHDVPCSPSSSTSTYAPATPRTPMAPSTAPPSYVDSEHLDAAAVALNKCEDETRLHSSREASWVTLPDMIVEEISRPSSYSHSSMISHREAQEDEDDISITDAYMDSRPTSPVMHHVYTRAPTPVPFVPSELPVPPPPALSFHRPFSPPSVYPITHPHITSHANDSTGIIVTVHTQSSRESL
ncbi:pheromone receptor [Lentinula edodes]|uniref:Pheromone receptor n=1 Tax=Lentinula edodes TaxID=5353 RepID=A0A1Q3ECA0_LENED|nr:pheromone receptor [Lentinula edodes]